jgi:hypothetical protein
MSGLAEIQRAIILEMIDGAARRIVRTRKALEADPGNLDLIAEGRIALELFEELRAACTKGSLELGRIAA